MNLVQFLAIGIALGVGVPDDEPWVRGEAQWVRGEAP